MATTNSPPPLLLLLALPIGGLGAASFAPSSAGRPPLPPLLSRGRGGFGLARVAGGSLHPASTTPLFAAARRPGGENATEAPVASLEREEIDAVPGGGSEAVGAEGGAAASSPSTSVMYTADEDFTATDSDFVVVGASDIAKDEVLNLLSSELGVRKVTGFRDPPGLPLGLVVERGLDTVEDMSVHLRRLPYKWGWQPDFVRRSVDDESGEKGDGRETVVVLGSGWGAHAFMKVADCSKLRVIVVSPSNHFVFTPMLASAAVGTVEYRSMTEAVRSANPLIHEFVEGRAFDVDLRARKVTVKLNPLLGCVGDECVDTPEIDLPYDRLVVSVGAKVADAGVPGASRCLRLKSCDDARNVRQALGECFEYASRPDVAGDDPESAAERRRRVTFLIVGGGPTGVELAGELSDFALDVTKPRVGAFSRLGGDVRVVLAHGGNEVLPQFDEGLRGEAGESLRRRGIDLRLNTYVTNVGDDGLVTLSTKVRDPVTGEISRTERTETVLPVGLTVWCAGTAPVPFVSRLLRNLPDEARCERGRVKVDRWLRPPTDDPSVAGTVFVLGDAAHFADGDDDSLPQTAQVAGQQGAYVARLLSRGYDMSAERPVLPRPPRDGAEEADGEGGAIAVRTGGKPLTDDEAAMHEWLRLRGLETAPGFSFFNLGLLAYLGGGEALSQVQIGDFQVFKWAGSVAFILWRSVYLVKQVATKNRVLVTFDWVKSAMFGRDVTRL